MLWVGSHQEGKELGTSGGVGDKAQQDEISEGQRCFSVSCNCRNSVFRKKMNPSSTALSVLFLSSSGK